MIFDIKGTGFDRSGATVVEKTCSGRMIADSEANAIKAFKNNYRLDFTSIEVIGRNL